MTFTEEFCVGGVIIIVIHFFFFFRDTEGVHMSREGAEGKGERI